MAYMNQEKKKALAPQIKAVLAKYGVKGSIGVDNYSSLVVTLKEGKLDFIGAANADNKAYAERTGQRFYEVKGNYQANPYYAHKSSNKKVGAFFKELVAAMNGKGSTIANHDNSDIMTDYFDVGWYVNINVGRWDRDYVHTGKAA
jgi:hypothetical protein